MVLLHGASNYVVAMEHEIVDKNDWRKIGNHRDICVQLRRESRDG